ncbi:MULTISPECIES: 5-formyltetrahydrofolate cyclo-ligase [unclassified Gilliamella]|uniref:5-formyltetrahydrofolate cyclo-ligase n=1 Tax=unclassified Gilliamella TaxID=2685620 RepID=UPI00226AD96B|nr:MULTISPECIES: 5-formyltetrahydrofolate cyclo-ligase [unclassified Gilliamella]MCX8600600.1 5-formyltetrahydrofolate cyclo-ligase [Gilliamella sp. B3722]MCX8609140.1 5-formyltetrahydrofolate cyclo-ligase [Gilliamella sp. B3771]MCX8609817.1 5-formyltetrahydrofolate cyclo-ligase [Gilliamella sp. B3891]MCX8612093.1 5-formyltetrahydrofolate cyclo-ligase [Gilliamella sp. B3773]MCX8615597.1 5-formyltetrahydrofolate cyclo-ligase [Gilliamella sp. B3770]
MNIRQFIRQKRRQLSNHERQLAQQAIYQKIANHDVIKTARNIGIFLSFDGEVDTKPIIEYLWQQNKSVYLPVIHPFVPYHLLFLKFTPDTPLSQNQYGILQPALNVSNVLPSPQLDVIFTPLVAFDDRGFRIGMGGGYYDRLLENYQQQQIYPIGLAFACQKIDHVDNQHWDVQLPEIIYA